MPLFNFTHLHPSQHTLVQVEYFPLCFNENWTILYKKNLHSLNTHSHHQFDGSVSVNIRQDKVSIVNPICSSCLDPSTISSRLEIEQKWILEGFQFSKGNSTKKNPHPHISMCLSDPVTWVHETKSFLHSWVWTVFKSTEVYEQSTRSSLLTRSCSTIHEAIPWVSPESIL